MKVYYPAAIHKEEDSDYGVSFPDVPGCISAGSTYREAMQAASEAIGLHLEGLVEDGDAVPAATSVEQWVRDAEYQDATWVLVEVETADLPSDVGEAVERRQLNAA